MKSSPSLLYSKHVPTLKEQFKEAIGKGVEKNTTNSDILVFFRADDIGVPSHQFEQMLTLFIKHKMPLGLAIVPSWFTSARKDALSRLTELSSSQWCWHQHGWLHKNHEPTLLDQNTRIQLINENKRFRSQPIRGSHVSNKRIAKKQEFGPSRSADAIMLDLQRGKQRLINTLGDSFFPLFTPPWNRCSATTLSTLVELQFKAISRSQGAQPEASEKLTEININVDLHTRKEPDPQTSLENLLMELTHSISSGLCGIMLHHQRMNTIAFHFLDTLLEVISTNQALTPLSYPELLEQMVGPPGRTDTRGAGFI